MKLNDYSSVPEFYQHYINLSPTDKDLEDVFLQVGILCWKHNSVALNKLGDKTYAPGKWTIPQLIAHINDCERVFGFRMLAALRGDEGVYPGFDEDVYADNNLAQNRSVISLIDELETIRNSNYTLLRYATEKELNNRMNANGKNLSAIEMAYISMGHSLHHFNIVKERYFTMNS
ncbi:MAG: DinB family protein [Crocinitomicaceae bacterium]|nr:DinB family protein [Crocinitomicaceae bacterium]